MDVFKKTVIFGVNYNSIGNIT